MTTNGEPATSRPARTRWRGSLSVRGLMLFVLVAGLGVGWFARGVAVRREALATIRAAGGTIFFRDQSKVGSGFWVWLSRRTGWEFPREVARVTLLPARSPRPGEPTPLALVSRDEAFAALGRLGRVETVMTEAGPIRPLHREALAAVGVVKLDLRAREGAVPDESLAELARVASLRTLDIAGSGRSGLPPALLRWVGAITQLRDLSVSVVAGTDMSAWPALDADSTTLSRLVDLETLDLVRAPSDGAFLDDLAAGHRLRELSVVGTRATDAQLRRLVRREPGLEHLGLNGSDLSDAGTGALADLPRLQDLALGGRPDAGPGITDATLATVARLGALRLLHLSCGRFTDRGLEALRGAPSLVSLVLGRFDSVSNDALSRLVAGRPWATLGLRGPGITDATLPAIFPPATAGGATYLSLRESGVTDAGMAALAGAPLRGLDLTGTEVTDAGMATLAKTSARVLTLDDTALTDAGLASLARGASITRVIARGTRVTPAGVAAFRRARGGRSSVDIGPIRPEDE